METKTGKMLLEEIEKEWPQHAERLKAIECVTEIDPDKASLAEIKKYFIEDMLTKQEFENFIKFAPPSGQGARGFIYRLEEFAKKYGLDISQNHTIIEILRELKEKI